MTTLRPACKLSAVSAALLALFGSALAQDNSVTELTQPDSTVSVGVGNWTADRHQQGIYDGMRDKGAYGLLDADITRRDDATGTWLKLKASDLGLDDRSIKGEYLRQGDMGVSLEYSRTPFDNPNTFTTRLLGIGSTTQTVSTNATPGPLREVNLGTKRDMTNLGVYKNLLPGLDFNVSFKNEDKNGDRAWGLRTAAPTQVPSFATDPINSTIRQLEATLNYTTPKLQLSGGYYGSWYDTQNTLATIYTAPASGPSYISLPLDNQAHQLFLNGGYSFTPSTRGTFKLAYTRATQDEHLPTQDVPGLSQAGSPQHLNGEVNTTLMQAGITSRPLKELSLLANLRYYDVHDATPVNRIYTNGPCSTAGNCVDNTPLSYKTLSGKMEGTYRLPDGYSLTAGMDLSNQDRDIPVSNAAGPGGTDTQRLVPFRYHLNENTYRLALRRSLSDTVNGSLTYMLGDRTGGTYGSSAGSLGGVASTYINPINIADRTRNKARMGIDWSPAENLSIQFAIEDSRDNYAHDNPYGVRNGNAQLYSVDASYTLNDKWKLDAWYSFDHNQAKQLNTLTYPTLTKDDNLENTDNSLGIGVRGDVSARVKLGADVQWTQNVSRYQQAINFPQTANFSGNLPDIKSTLLRLKFFSQYAIDKNSDVRFDLIHERWKTNDWTWMFADTTTPFAYGATTDGTTVTANQKQIANFIGVRYIYKFH